MTKKRVLVAGGGPAGMFAAIIAAESGCDVTLWEKNPNLGRKLLLTGKGRCNLTNAADRDDIIKNLTGNGKFLYSAFELFDNNDLCYWFEEHGLPLVTERGQRVFPQSGKAADVLRVLEKEMQKSGVKIVYERPLTAIMVEDGVFKAAKSGKYKEDFDALILATGGATYQKTGSTGDGYRLASAIGHTQTEVMPSLVPLVAAPGSLPAGLKGFDLRNVEVELLTAKGKKLGKGFGEMGFNSDGVGGPLILTLSDAAVRYWRKHQGEILTVSIDLKPALTEQQLDARLQRDLQKYHDRLVGEALDDLFPQQFIPAFIEKSGVDPQTPVGQLSKETRKQLVNCCKAFTVEVKGPRSLNEGIVTAGGLKVGEFYPQTFESKLIGGFYAIGEVLDIHGFTGGYNLQACFSAAFAAGKAVAESI